jgi:hypothetical protein
MNRWRLYIVAATAWLALGLLFAFVLVFAWIIVQVFVQVVCGAPA